MATKRTPEERIAYHEAQLAKARRDKRNADARKRRKAEKEAKEERARKAEELLSFLEGHTVTRKERTMTGLDYVNELRDEGVFSDPPDDDGEHDGDDDTLQVSDADAEHAEGGADVADSRSDQVTSEAGITVDSLVSDDARPEGDGA